MPIFLREKKYSCRYWIIKVLILNLAALLELILSKSCKFFNLYAVFCLIDHLKVCLLNPFAFSFAISNLGLIATKAFLNQHITCYMMHPISISHVTWCIPLAGKKSNWSLELHSSMLMTQQYSCNLIKSTDDRIRGIEL